MTDTKNVKAKRLLKNIDFSKTDSHIALVGPAVGGPASGADYALVIKSNNFSEEFIKKMQQVRVTMELDDFLETFFSLWEDDAQVLAAMMGYKEEAEGESEPAGTYNDESFYSWYSDKMMAEGKMDEYGSMPESTTADEQEWIASRLEGIEVLKSLRNSDSVAETLSKLSEDQYLGMLRDQERVEKALANKELAIAAKVAKEAAVVAEKKKPKARIVTKSTASEVKATQATPKIYLGNVAKAVKADPKTEVQKMTVKTVEVEKTEQVEMVEKSQFDFIHKALEEQKVELEKASAMIALFQAEKKVAIAKARKEAIVAAVEKEEEAELLFKAVGELADADFDTVVAVVKGLKGKADKAADQDLMFQQVGAADAGEVVQKSALRIALEAKYKK